MGAGERVGWRSTGKRGTVHRLREGKIVRVELYPSRSEALEAAGLRDSVARSAVARAWPSPQRGLRSGHGPGAPLGQTEEGLAPVGEGWFVLNARQARWRHRAGRGESLPLTGWEDADAETYFPQLGINLFVLGPGEPIGMYHWEADQEGFLVLSGEALLIVEGKERPLRQWDFVHCPPETRHIIVGAGDGPCVVLAVGARQHIDEDCNGGALCRRRGCASARGLASMEETSDPERAYARFPDTEPTRYGDGWLPNS